MKILTDGDKYRHLVVDYSQIGLAVTFTVPYFRFVLEELRVGDTVIVVGDGVDDQFANVDAFDPSMTRVTLTLFF